MLSWKQRKLQHVLPPRLLQKLLQRESGNWRRTLLHSMFGPLRASVHHLDFGIPLDSAKGVRRQRCDSTER